MLRASKSYLLVTRHAAYASMSAFIAAYETPAKIILQLFVALLRAYLHEYNDLIRVSLDLLLTCLPNRLKPDDFAKAMKWSQKIMLDALYNSSGGSTGGTKRSRSDSSSSPPIESSTGPSSSSSSSSSSHRSNSTNNATTNTLRHLQMWQVVLRHSEIFYAYRSYFIAHMINTVTLFSGVMSPQAQQATSRSAPAPLPAASTCEEEMRRHIALGIVDVIINWEYYRGEQIKLARAASPRMQVPKQAVPNASQTRNHPEDSGQSSAKRVKLSSGEAAPVSAPAPASSSAPVPVPDDSVVRRPFLSEKSSC